MAGERKVTTTEAGENLILELNSIAVNCDDAISSLKKLGYKFPDKDAPTATYDENKLVELIRECQTLIDDALSEYKLAFGTYMIDKCRANQ